jgi:hypothetical protein
LSIVPDPVSPITPPLDAVKPGQGRLYAAEYADYLPKRFGRRIPALAPRQNRGRSAHDAAPKAGLSRPPRTLYESIFQRNGSAAICVTTEEFHGSQDDIQGFFHGLGHSVQERLG